VNKILVISSLLFILISCSKKEESKINLSINGRPLAVEIARTKAQREKGLMYRDEIGENEGMLFIFKKDQILSFWMKDTKIPLSIAFIDKKGKVIDMFDMEPYSLVPVRSSKLCKYAIEVNRDFYRSCNLNIGDRIDLGMVE